MNSVLRTRYRHQSEYQTKDGSTIRELMHPTVHGEPAKNLSLAEATVAPGQQTALHVHHQTEELYYIVSGKGLMQVGDDELNVETGDTICIPPGTPHSIRAIGEEALKILCCCSPAYAHEDTELV